MFSKLREILLTQYIGSILIALLAVQALAELITTVVWTGFWVFNHSRADSVLGGSSSAPFRWENLISDGVKIALYFLTAYGLARWLYAAQAPITHDELEGEPSPEPTDPDEADRS
ncbi:MAG TPA: hypothetical protein VMD76_02635 [Candidatus Sulfotelmatobacter sp.]|nr:hypothetical protein [Candidatus Sulfotelmatobacter sp.]